MVDGKRIPFVEHSESVHLDQPVRHLFAIVMPSPWFARYLRPPPRANMPHYPMLSPVVV